MGRMILKNKIRYWYMSTKKFGIMFSVNKVINSNSYGGLYEIDSKKI